MQRETRKPDYEKADFNSAGAVTVFVVARRKGVRFAQCAG
jgi:hypothetical protein